MTIAGLQENLHRAGYDAGPYDDSLGPQTYRALVNFCAGRDIGDRAWRLGVGMAQAFPHYEITTRERICHFLAQTAHETGGFKNLVELGSGDGGDADPYDDYLERYDHRKDLGNEDPGDGERTRGRGLIMITGEGNYEQYGRRLGIDLINHPERAAEPEIAVQIACLFWVDHGLNELADDGDVKLITKRINGGLNGLEDRVERLDKLMRLWPE